MNDFYFFFPPLPASNFNITLYRVTKLMQGKTLIARKISRYLNWIGIPAAVFHVAEYRRKRYQFRRLLLSVPFVEISQAGTSAIVVF
jgi:hypothetical protein